MSIEALLNHLKNLEQKRIRQWIKGIAILWIALWGLYWGLSLLQSSMENTPLEKETEVVEAFSEIYPIELWEE